MTCAHTLSGTWWSTRRTGRRKTNRKKFRFSRTNFHKNLVTLYLPHAVDFRTCWSIVCACWPFERCVLKTALTTPRRVSVLFLSRALLSRASAFVSRCGCCRWTVALVVREGVCSSLARTRKSFVVLRLQSLVQHCALFILERFAMRLCAHVCCLLRQTALDLSGTALTHPGSPAGDARCFCTEQLNAFHGVPFAPALVDARACRRDGGSPHRARILHV